VNDLTKINSFPITVYGALEKFNDVTSKARCRVFYKGVNRNGSFISDDFAEQLLATIPYTPVKGIYDGDDFTDHGKKRELGRIYGIVPENPHFAWEKHMDEDGVEREYACVDILLFTALYSEAEDIVGKAQSMELYDKSIEGEWIEVDGQKCFSFTRACFLGLQILGEETEPCFEGAAFFSLYESVAQMVKKIEEYNLKLKNINKGGHAMLINYKLSDRAKCQKLWNLLNTNYTEEGNWTVDYEICEVYDDYALCKNYSEDCFERVYYEKKKAEDDGPEDEVFVCGKKKAYILDVTEEEYAALNAIKVLNQGTYEKIDNLYNETNEKVENLTNEKSAFELKITELTENVSTLTTERDEIRTQYDNANVLLNETKTTLENVQSAFETLQSENASLTEYKKNIELTEKQAIIDSYSEMLSEEVLAKYTAAVDTFTAEQLDKELAYELKKANPQVFSKSTEFKAIPKDNNPKSGLEQILSKYQK